MISKDRPLKAMVYVPPHWRSPEYRSNDPFQSHTCDTIDAEGYFDTEEFHIVASCTATWFEKDGRLELDATTGLNTWERRSEVRCMEPALYYVNIPKAGGGGVFCEYHKPRVHPL